MYIFPWNGDKDALWDETIDEWEILIHASDPDNNLVVSGRLSFNPTFISAYIGPLSQKWKPEH